MSPFDPLDLDDRTSPLSRFSLQLMLGEAAQMSIAGDHQAGLKAAEDVRRQAQQLGDPSLEALAVYEILRARAFAGDDPGALAAASWIIAKLQDPVNTISLPSYELCATYFLWSEAAIKLSDTITENALHVLDAWERTIGSMGLAEWLPQLLHARSKVLKRLQRVDDALAVAEEGLARKRAQARSPGCSLSCFLQVYLELLGLTGRREEHRAVLAEFASLAELASLEPASGWLQNRLAWALYETAEDLPRAEFIARQAVALAPNEPAILQTLAAILIREDKWNEGISRLAEYLRSETASLESSWEEDVLAFTDAVGLGHSNELLLALRPVAEQRNHRDLSLILHAIAYIRDGDQYLLDTIPSNDHMRIRMIAEQILRPTPGMRFPS
ncbi:MAG TPA: hypothetical protein VG125_02095 [Pirellulales bacterium]|jgi:hypothetical protein|nr:hypothetical protein [Pirellulales bacterium]